MLKNSFSKIEFPKILIKLKNRKTFHEAQTSSRLQEIIHPSRPPIPPGTPEIYSNQRKYVDICFQSASKVHFLRASRNGAVQMLHQPDFCWNICKVKKVFGCVAGAYLFQCRLT